MRKCMYMKKRMAIFVFYDKDNIVDEYVYFLLAEIKKVVSYLTVVCNGNISEKDHWRMREFAEDVFERENIGFDAGAIKDVILNYVGIEKIKNYKELLITNDTVYGPLYPLSEVFKRMEGENVDFWGLTQTGNPRFLQSYFLVVRENMLHSTDFQNFWEQMRYYSCFRDVLRFYERRFTPYFEEKGYNWTSYISVDKYKEKCYEEFLNPYYHLFDETLKNKNRMPFLKRKPMANKYSFQLGHVGILFKNYIAAVQSIAKQKYFDFSMVWNNLLRVYPLHDIQIGCNLTYVLETGKKSVSCMKDVLLVVKVNTELFLPELTEKCNNFAKIANVWVYADDDILQRLEPEMPSAVRLISSDRNEDASICSGILENNEDYRYICWLDTRDYMQDNLSYAERKGRYICYIENLCENEGYIARVRCLLEREEQLGMLFPPQFFEKQMQKDKENKARLQDFCKELNISVPLPEETSFMNNIHSFWIKRKLAEDFVKRSKRCSVCLKDFESGLIGEALACYAQTKGYYAGIVKCSEYATVEAADKEEYLFEKMELLRILSGRETYFEQKLVLKDKILVTDKIIPFIKKHKRVYIYGTGEVAKRITPMLQGVAGFIVSDGHSKGEYLYNIPIIYFSEYKYEPGDGIILALNSENGRQVMEMLEKQNLTVDILPYHLQKMRG